MVPEDDKVARLMEKNTIQVDKYGFVTLVGSLGGDASVVAAARTSYNKGDFSPDAPLTEKDIKLIDYLMRNRHTSPFEFVQFQFTLKLPIFVMRQLVRHRTLSINEWSARYSELADENYPFGEDDVRGQADWDKQASAERIEEEGAVERILGTYHGSVASSHEAYRSLLGAGLSRENARMVLPVSTYTRCAISVDLHNLFHLLKLRMDPHAQYQTRAYAQAMHDLAERVAPYCFAAWREHVQNARTFSAGEVRALAQALNVEALERALERCTTPSVAKGTWCKLGFKELV